MTTTETRRQRQGQVGRTYRASRPRTPYMGARQAATNRLKALGLAPRRFPALLDAYIRFFLVRYS